MTNRTTFCWLAAIGIAVSLTGCKWDDEATTGATATSAATSPPASPANSKPVISGTPITSARADQSYDFTPSASDPDNDPLTFSVRNKPSWASFEAATGRLSGTPAAGDVGTFANVAISVTDGKDSSLLPAFTVNVEQIALGAATLSWTPPTENTDGSALTDLAGYKVYYGRSQTSLDQIVTLTNPGLTSYMIENLSAATWYFAMTSYNTSYVESERSAVASKTVT